MVDQYLTKFISRDAQHKRRGFAYGDISLKKEGMAMEKGCRDKYTEITEILIRKNLTISTMESCTAGLISSLLTDTEGSSAVIKGAFVTYSNEAKVRMGVPEEIIEKYGIYSKETAQAMADACRKFYDADIGIGVTGSFSNPDPNNADSIPGEVFFAIALKEQKDILSFTLNGIKANMRKDVKMEAAERIADELLGIICGE